MRFSRSRPLYFEQADLFQKEILKEYKEEGFGFWAVILAETRKLMGYSGLKSQLIEGEKWVKALWKIFSVNDIICS